MLNFSSRMAHALVNGFSGGASTARGALIVLEGCDRSGKSTQSKLLVDGLRKRGVAVERIAFPDRSTAIGQAIDGYIKGADEMSDQVIHLLFSANRWERVPFIHKALQSGTTLIVDRYAYSGVVYTAAKGLSLDWCRAPDIGLPQPDVVFFLDLEPNRASIRGEFGDERYERQEFQQKVYDAYKRLMKIEKNTWKCFNADQTIDVLQSELLDAANKLVESVKQNNTVVGKLWCEGTSVNGTC